MLSVSDSKSCAAATNREMEIDEETRQLFGHDFEAQLREKPPLGDQVHANLEAMCAKIAQYASLGSKEPGHCQTALADRASWRTVQGRIKGFKRTYNGTQCQLRRMEEKSNCELDQFEFKMSEIWDTQN